MRQVWGSGAALLVLACGGRGDTRAPSATRAPAASSQSSRAPAAAGVAPGAVDMRPRVLIIGTSITAGFGLDDVNDAYPSVVQHLADSAGVQVHVVNAGLSGETSAGALRRVDWLLTDSAAVVIVETGANDGLRALDPDSTAANLRAIVRRIHARSPHARVVIAQMEAPPNIGATYTTRFHAVFPRVAKETGAVLMPFLLDGVAGDPRLNQADGIHPTAEGAKRVGANVWRTLKLILSQ